MATEPSTMFELQQSLSALSIKEILTRVKGTFPISRKERGNKDALINIVVQHATPQQCDFLKRLGQEKLAEKGKSKEHMAESRKRKMLEDGARANAARRQARINSDTAERDITKFFNLPSPEQIKQCHHDFFEATSQAAVAQGVCGICAREVTVAEEALSRIPFNLLPNRSHLKPHVLHPAQHLVDGCILEPKGLHASAEGTEVSVCGQCLTALQSGKESTKLPKLSLANNLWIGEVPWQIKSLTFPEQLLISLLYPRVYVFKMFPRRFRGRRDTSSLQRGII